MNKILYFLGVILGFYTCGKCYYCCYIGYVSKQTSNPAYYCHCHYLHEAVINFCLTAIRSY